MRVAKWGNSLAIRLPKALVNQLVLRPGDEVKIVAAAQGSLEIVRDDTAVRKAAALDRMSKRRWLLPTDYKFDREETNSRK